jgi:uncharacterized membrane protein
MNISTNIQETCLVYELVWLLLSDHLLGRESCGKLVSCVGLKRVISFIYFFQVQIYFKLQMGVLPGNCITTTIEHTNAEVIYTIHISHTHKCTYRTK